MFMDNLKRRHIAHTLDRDEPAYERISLQDDEDLYMEKVKARKGYRHSQIAKYVSWSLENKHILLPIILTALSFYTRFRNIDLSNAVVWDEAHFGKFGSYYLKREFYFDVHPPLGKMLVGFSGWLAGYDGSFKFESGKEYPEDVNYAAMRIFNALWGALVIPVAYGTCRNLGMSLVASTLAATMVLCDTAYLCISRFILLDSMLLFFTCSTLYCLSGLHKSQTSPFSKAWWFWLTATGVSLGCVSSVKWVGLFAVAMVGAYTLEDLWEKFGDLKLPKAVYFGHWIARAVALIAIPVAIYVASFVAHFAILTKSGTGDANMSSLFQARLEGSSLGQGPLEIAVGSRVTIKNAGMGGGLLHSHTQKYPDGSKQQQITCYHHKDTNNDWMIAKPFPEKEHYNPDDAETQYIGDGDLIRLVHEKTSRKLHSHPIPAPVSSDQFEVSGYGSEEVTDRKDNWKVEFVDDIGDAHTPKSRIRALSTRFRLRHAHLGCLLTARNIHLPQWGFKQVEVVCDREAKDNDAHAWWNIEEHVNEKLPPAPKSAFRSNFLKDFIQLNNAMWRTNNALIPDPDKDDKLASTPMQWPMVSVGLRMCGWDDNRVKFFLLGNPIVWWSSFASLWVFVLAALTYNCRMRRQLHDLTPSQWERFLFIGKTLFTGWFLHYVPFFIMGRVTYLHHYFPALYFSILMVPFLADHFTANASRQKRATVFGVAFIAVIASFIHFSPIAFGMTGPATDYSSRRWFAKWTLTDTLY